MNRAMSAEQVAQDSFAVHTHGRGFSDITARVDNLVSASHVQTGIANIFTAHTSCSLLISENADPAVRRDLERWFARAVPDGDAIFEHDAEGPDDMPSHIRAALTQTSIGIPVKSGKPALGTWQGLYVFEHRDAPHQREMLLHFIGD